MLREPFDAAAAELNTVYERLGDVPLDDTNAVVRKGDDAAAMWARATDANRTIDRCVAVWQRLAQLTRFAPDDRPYRVLRIADVTGTQLTEHGLRDRKVRGWDARRIGLRLGLADAAEYRQRVQAIESALAPAPDPTAVAS